MIKIVVLRQINTGIKGLRILLFLPFVLILTLVCAQTELEKSGDLIAYQEMHHPVVGQKGMVVAQNQKAAEIGALILKQGGNAVDAAVGIGFSLAVTLPQAGNIGGGGFMLVYMAQSKETIAIDYYGETPGKIARYEADPHKTDQQFSYQNIAIPGTVAGLWAAHQHFGKLPWHVLLAPAIALAKDGMVLTHEGAHVINQRKAILSKNLEARKIFFKQNGESYRMGEIFKQPDLAQSLMQIQAQGANAFYHGELAKRFIQGIQKNGGTLSLVDLAHYRVKIQKPIWFNYRGYHIASMPPPAGGVVLAAIMNLLEQFPIRKLGSNTASSIHLLAEILKLGHYDFHWVGGSSQWKTPSKGIMSKDYAKKRAQWIQQKHLISQKQVESKTPIHYEDTDTTHYSVADKAGNVVSNTYTLSASFGAHVVAPQTGILLNNSLRNLMNRQTHPVRKKSRAPLPYKRISSTITPVIVFKKGKPWLVSGTLGGTHIMGIMAQLLSNVIDHRFNIAEATMRPRIHQLYTDTPLKLEYAISEDVIPILAKKGHLVKRSYTMGSTQSIILEKDYFYGAADSRRPNAAAISVDAVS